MAGKGPKGLAIPSTVSPLPFSSLSKRTVSSSSPKFSHVSSTRERLRERAAETGEWLRSALRKLADEEDAHGALVGDVRGSGLFIGIEFVRERDGRTPATAETNRLCSRLKDEHRILTSIDGPHDNVLVVKPPMCFGIDEAKELVAALRVELVALKGVDLNQITHTPT